MTHSLDAIEVVSFFVADHADAVGGKVYVNGGFWNLLQSPTYPNVFPSIAVVAVLEVPFAEHHRDHKIEIGLRDEDWKPLPLKIEAGIRVGADASKEHGEPSIVPFAANIVNVLIDFPGRYSFYLKVDGEEKASYVVKAIQVPQVVQVGSPEANTE